MSIEKESMQNISIQNKSTSNQTLDKKNRKLPTPSERGKPMTEEEWDRYFECRKIGSSRNVSVLTYEKDRNYNWLDDQYPHCGYNHSILNTFYSSYFFIPKPTRSVKNRKIYDKPMTREEINALLDKSTKLDSTHMDSPDMEEWIHLMQMMPVTPSAALALKHVQGFQALMEVNLYDAKQAYPDEF